VYDISDRKDEASPVVITDLLGSDIDAPEFSNEEFKIEDGQIKFNRAGNKIINGSFIKEGTTQVFPGWDCSAGVVPVHDYSRVESLLHGRSAKLPGPGEYIQQMITNINSSTPYCFSFYGMSSGCVAQVKIYEFNNGGNKFTSLPLISTATNVLTYVPKSMSTTYTRYVSRVYANPEFSKDATQEMHYVERTLPSLRSDTTDIIVCIERVEGAQPMYIDAVQFEVSNNPGYFDGGYDYAIVEYETSSLGYMPRFDVSSVKNPLNNGFLVMDFVDVKVNDTGLPSDNISVEHRRSIKNYFARRPWAKLYGVTKYRQTAEFSKKRIPHRGEYFLLPVVRHAKNIAFQAERLLNTQSVIEFQPEKNDQIIIIEDTNGEPIPDKELNLSYGTSRTQYVNHEVKKTDSTGSAKFTGPAIYSEDVSPFISYGTSGFNSQVTILKSTDVLSFSAGKYVYGFNSDGTYSAVYQSVSGGGLGSLTVATGVTDWGSSAGAISGWNYYITGTEAGYIKLPYNLAYDPDPVNSGSSVFSYLAGLDNTERQIGFYNNTTATTVATTTVTRTQGVDYFDLSGNSAFSPIRGSLLVQVANRPLLLLSESNSNDGFLSRFFVDYENKRVYMADQTILSITISWRVHPVKFIGREVHFHRSVLFNILKELYNKVQQSEAANQHQLTYNTDLSAIIEANHPLLYELFLKFHTNVNLYVKARHKGLTDNATMVYQHRKPLI